MRSHIVFAWEIGAGFGHLTPAAVLGQELRRRGHRVSAVVPARSPACRMLEPLGIEVLDVPEPVPPVHAFPVSLNYAANLLRNGYWHGPTLGRRLAVWRSLLDRLRPDLLVADHAPAALLAGRGSRYPVSAIGHGFTLPPLHTPMPSLQPWFPVAEARLTDLERRFLGSVNPLLEASGNPPLASVAGLFDGVERLLCIEPELDHYATRTDQSYLGAIEPIGGLPPPPIEAGVSPVFVYLDSRNRFLPSLLQALRVRDIPTLAYIAGGDGLAQAEPPDSPVRHLAGLVDLHKIATRCRLAVTHGGTLSASLFLKRGIKLLICPQDLEKALLARRLVERKLAWATNWFSVDDDQPAARLDAILESPPPDGLEAFAARWSRGGDGQNIAGIVDRLERRVAAGHATSGVLGGWQ